MTYAAQLRHEHRYLEILEIQGLVQIIQTMDSNDFSLPLGSLFFEKPIVHKVKPLHQEASAWLLEPPPSFTEIPATQELQEEAESLTTLYSRDFSQRSDEALCTSDVNNDDDIDGTRSGSHGSRLKQGFWRGRGADETPPDSGHRINPSKRRSLFKTPASTSGGDSSKTDDLSTGSCRPQTFLTQPLLPPPPLGSSAVSGRPLQQGPCADTQHKATKRALVPPMTPQPLHIQGTNGCGVLRPVSEIPVKFRSVFSEFPFFNYVQSKALDDVLYTGKNFVACAPTGSGKTVLFELAIIRLLMETMEPWRDVKAVYMAPIKALCSQCSENWKKKFGPLGLNCKEITGDTEIDDFFEIQDSQIILTTPEKWDSLTRKWKDNCLLQLVRLFLIDEVHVVKDTTRGATLEVVVSRMKAVHTHRTLQDPEGGLSMRFVAVSATIPNVSDIADWLSNESGPATYLHMDESHRPVKLRKVVLGFPCSSNQTEFKFDLSLNYKMANVIQTYSEQKPALVFCSTRKGAQQSASVLAKDARFIMSVEHKQRLMKYANSILDSKLRDLVMLGVGFHHAGVGMSDRKMVEKAFTLGDLPVLFTTRTLAMGVNLPAHLVVIKSTMQYVAGACEEYSEADLLQMIGRAGRPQFDTSATAVIMTKIQTRNKYLNIMNGVEIIESSLHTHLVEHLNAEIVLQTISDVNMALDWIRSTFLYIRALKNPTHYGFSADSDRYDIEAKLQELCLKNLNSLSSIGLIDMDEDINIKPTEAGRLMARYCVAFETMKQFSKVSGTEDLSELIELVSKSKEFSDVQLRVNEKRPLNTLNRDKNRVTIRFPIDGKIKSSEMKVNCLIQAQLGSILIQEYGLTQDTARIFRSGMRVSKCLSEFLNQRSKTGFSALLNSVTLAKCFRAKLWENSSYVSKQLEKIGQSLSTAMVNAGLTTFSKIEQTNPRELELILNRHPPFGNQIRESVLHLPKYDVTLEQLPKYSRCTAEVVVRVSLKNQAELLSRRTAEDQHFVSLIIGNADNMVVFLQKLTDMALMRTTGSCWSKKIDVPKASKGDEISVNLISSTYVGLDVQLKFTVHFSAARGFVTENVCNLTPVPTGQEAEPQSVLVKQTSVQRQLPTPVDRGFDKENKRDCNHFCKNKDMCGHDCCKVGVAVARKRSTSQESSFCSYLKDLRNRADALVQTPVKRLKMKISEESASVNMQAFAYTPKQTPAPVTWPPTDGKGYTLQQDVICLDDGNDGYDDYVEEVQEHTPSWTSAHSYRPSSVMWAGPEVRGHSHHHHHHQEAVLHHPSQDLMPSVSFDLGDVLDDWGDFDDRDLVHASDASLSTTNPKPQIVQRLRYDTSDSNIKSVYPSSSLAQQCLPTASTATRPVCRPVSPKVGTFGPTCVSQAFTPQRRITRHWNQTKPNIFYQDVNARTPEFHPKPPHVAPVTRRLDFFTAMSFPTSPSATVNTR
ncbi:probable ATP-dependent DNA helicase HFM1 [Gouania willdenowi]|uniref:probable ATP-dependent DNA helicase HFM1 n=1 Tax=Gouania willdenowi TaxID=441366 RepID=UPI001056693F|nr:probable ATP-dependent DNA helicase HFM1 [Gouania willdenowi]